MLFTLLAERDERKSVLVTTNLVFSEWERIFTDPMTTLQPAGAVSCRAPLHRELSAQEKVLSGAAWAAGPLARTAAHLQQLTGCGEQRKHASISP